MQRNGSAAEEFAPRGIIENENWKCRSGGSLVACHPKKKKRRKEPRASQTICAQLQDGQIRDTMIIESLQQASPMLRNMAYRYHSDYDDLYQVAAEALLHAYTSAQRARDPRAYLHRTIHYAILRHVGVASHRRQSLADHYAMVSLDAPLADYPTFSLQDVISEPAPAASEDRDYAYLYACMGLLPDAYREAICMHFGLSGYGVERPRDIAGVLGVSRSAVYGRLYRALATLRKHSELIGLVRSRA